MNKKRGDIVQTSLIKYKSTTSFIQKLLLIPKYWIIGFLRKKKIEFTINKKEKKQQRKNYLARCEKKVAKLNGIIVTMYIDICIFAFHVQINLEILFDDDITMI